MKFLSWLLTTTGLLLLGIILSVATHKITGWGIDWCAYFTGCLIGATSALNGVSLILKE